MAPGVIIPAIIPESLEHLSVELEKLREVTSTFQIDIVDGVFVPFTSWPYNAGAHPADIHSSIGAFKIEFDLMIQEPERTLTEWLHADAERFVIHVESTNDMPRCIQMIREEGKKAGIALGNDTPLETIEPFIDDIDFVQCMGIARIGTQGEGFDERVIGRVRMMKEKHPHVEIAVDGSINEETIERVYEAGATRLVSGSAIFASDSPIGAYNELLKRVA